MITVEKFLSGAKRGIPGDYFEIKGINFNKLYNVVSNKGESVKSSDSYLYNGIKMFKDVNRDKSVIYGINIIGTNLNCYSDFVYITDERKIDEIVNLIKSVVKQ